MLLAQMMRRLGAGLGLALSIAGAMLACGSARLPAPTYVGQPTEALQRVEYPPPPARVEHIPAEPAGGTAVWLDGEWQWQGTRWAWKQGRWVVPPADAKYSPWTSTRDVMGFLYVAEGKWRDNAGHVLADPKPVAVGRTRGGAVVNAEGEEVAASPNVPTKTREEAPGRAKAGDSGPPETPSGTTPTGTEPTAPVVPDAAPPSDAGLADVTISDALDPPDALPLRSPRMDPH